MTGSWTFGQKLAAVLGVFVVLSALLAGVSVYAVSRVTTSHEQVLATIVENLISAERLRAAALDKSAQARGFLLSGDEAYARRMTSADQQFAATLRDMRDRAAPDNLPLMRAVEDAMAVYKAAVDDLGAQRRQGADTGTIVATFEEAQTPLFAALDESMVDLVARLRGTLEERTEEARNVGSGAETAVVGVSVFAIALAILLAMLLGRTLAQQIGTSVQHVRSSSTELQAAASQQASGAKEQATAMSEISTTVTELLTTSRQIAESAQRVADVAEGTATSAIAGRGAVHEAERSIENIRQQVDAIVRHMLDVGKKSQQIGGILAIINELAEQTNILAINATIEAAGAGEAGKRFAVVGDEVRKLAERVGGSSKQVGSLIEEMREAVNATVMATETHSKAVDAGAQTFARLSSVLDQITSGVDTTKEVAREIELSTKQQTTAVEQVNVAIADVAQATREAEAGSSQTLQTASQLAGLSDQLARLIHAPSAAQA